MQCLAAYLSWNWKMSRSKFSRTLSLLHSLLTSASPRLNRYFFWCVVGFGNGSGLSPKPEDFEAFSGPENPRLKPAGFRAWYKINLISKKKKFQWLFITFKLNWGMHKPRILQTIDSQMLSLYCWFLKTFTLKIIHYSSSNSLILFYG